ncbi:MAG: hypothetical protein H6753_04920 [Candidatus Omnitrophica bacterium]|nr:hypothetical protein [Candidatus Omnitrophota bacterium]
MPLGIIFIALFVIITFVIGVSFLFRGYLTLPSAEKFVPIAELEKVQSDLKLANGEMEKLRTQSNTLAVQLDAANSKLTWALDNVKTLEETLRKGAQLQPRLDQLEQDLNFLSQKADAQAQEAIDVITRLAAENEGLQHAVEIPPVATNTDELAKLTDENQKFKIQVEGYASKVKELETAVESLQQTSAQITELNQVRATLTEENLVLKKNLSELEEQIKTAQSYADDLKAEHSQNVLELQNKIAQLDADNLALKQAPVQPIVQISQEEVDLLRAQHEERIVQANTALVKLNAEMELLNERLAQKDASLKKLTEDLLASRQEVAVSLREIVDLKTALPNKMVVSSVADDQLSFALQERDELQKSLQELQTVHENLRLKEKIMMQKLVQSRAQTMSLEKICEDFQYQNQ